MLQYSTAFVALGTSNFDLVVDFYSNLLSQQPHPYEPKRYAQFNLLGLRLGIFQPKGSHETEFNNSARSGLSLCLEVENLEKAIALLTNMGYPPDGKINVASHGQEIYTYDPDGNRLILHQSS
ncbi:VOC family protein [Crocosphaera chwakensis]|uniref:Glyoxalase/bleomycin resistance protein/dioxygenase n=1 Tax=Crocosphaera chwakensis CCY0110 TaxID=391612 RepID=A3IVB5_9CHRO|nr:glyoxalase/bleomycin resistance/dioxygenase family protein [Crocosphaera chwakensis]EAZ89584.1 Glyoxalase/bleomycin resistance protein/dioxygenase [Crocosphaera chwakensis CCY0110]